ncbi:MAG TPA: hypothetical protein VD968_06185 [Pyrinomonadaceae bacterium]|nr:hypothetical protein [Pyrinomonadaceae bacterium]
MSSPAQAQGSAARRRGTAPLLRPSNVLQRLAEWKKARPRASARSLARRANAMLAREGLDYIFNACDIVEANRSRALRVADAETGRLVFDYTFEGARGARFPVRLDAGDHAGMCGECFVAVPALRVTPREMVAVLGGRARRLLRPRGFSLDEAHLVGPDLKTVLRTWQMPYQTIPVGVSADGRKLYLDFYEDLGLGELALELSDDGRPRFVLREEVTGPEGEWISDFPEDPENAYLSFLRFRRGGGSHVVRFSGPCT